MEYQIQVKELLIEDDNLTLNIMGTVTDPSINAHFVSKPKLILHFINRQEDRRIPLVLSNVIHTAGKCYFSGRYTYRLDLLFWKTRKQYLPFDLYFNFSFVDYYEEKIPVPVQPEVFQVDNKQFRCRVKSNHFAFVPDRKAILHSPLRRGVVKVTEKLVKLAEYLCAICMLPLFFIEAILHFSGVLRLPPRFNDENHPKRFVAYILWRFSEASGIVVAMWTFKRWLFKRCFDFYKLFPVKRNKITFISLRRNDVSGNFAFVYDKIKDDKSLDIHFILNDHTIAYMTFKEIVDFTKSCASSKIVVLDEFTPMIHYIDLRRETKLVQLWHACGAFKTFGFTRLSKPKGSPQMTANHRSYDYVTVSSTFCKKCHSEGFGISTDNVVATGIPRTDVFFDEDYKQNARKQFFDAHPNFRGKKIILFAPTFRGAVKETAFYPTELFDVEKVCAGISEEYAIIIKHHPFVQDKQPVPAQYSDRVIDLSAESELNDLLFVTDVIITDYSSLVFEASLLAIPMIFYAFDLEHYIDERDFYFDFKQYVPGKIAYSLDDLIAAIHHEDYCVERIAPFADMFFDNRDGKATDRVVKLLYDNLK